MHNIRKNPLFFIYNSKLWKFFKKWIVKLKKRKKRIIFWINNSKFIYNDKNFLFVLKIIDFFPLYLMYI